MSGRGKAAGLGASGAACAVRPCKSTAAAIVNCTTRLNAVKTARGVGDELQRWTFALVPCPGAGRAAAQPHQSVRHAISSNGWPATPTAGTPQPSRRSALAAAAPAPSRRYLQLSLPPTGF